LLKALGLETGDDADHDNIAHDTRDPAIPPAPAVSQQDIDDAKKTAAACVDMATLTVWWKTLNKTAIDVAAHPDVIAAKDARKAQLSQKDAA
jgi:hypothetical protein